MSESTRPAVAQAAEDQPDVAGAVEQSRGAAYSKAAVVLSVAALGLSFALTATAYFTWHALQQLGDAQRRLEDRFAERTGPLRDALETLSGELQQQRRELEMQSGALAEEQRSLGYRLRTLAELVARGAQGWALSEVEYLLRIANESLLLQRDVETARAALNAADSRLRELADPLFTGVRESIAADLQALGAVPDVDQAGIAAGLHGLTELVDELPVAGSRYRPVDTLDGSADGGVSKVANWRELPALVWASLSQLFRVRDHAQPVTPMLPPENEYFLRENLRLQLAAARLAMLRDDRVQYQEALETARRSLELYFDVESGGVKEALARLEVLAERDIHPRLPDVSGSLQVLRQQMALREQQVAPARPPATQGAKQPAKVAEP